MNSSRFLVTFLWLFQPNSAAAKLLKGKGRSGSDSAEPHHQSRSGGKDKAADASSRSAHHGVPQVQAKTPIINVLRKQPAVSSFQPPSNISSNPQGQPQHFSAPSASRSQSYPRRVNSRRISRRSDSHRHLLPVSQTLDALHLFSLLHLHHIMFDFVFLGRDFFKQKTCG